MNVSMKATERAVWFGGVVILALLVYDPGKRAKGPLGGTPEFRSAIVQQGGWMRLYRYKNGMVCAELTEYASKSPWNGVPECFPKDGWSLQSIAQGNEE